jgi:hypothetical protein
MKIPKILVSKKLVYLGLEWLQPVFPIHKYFFESGSADPEILIKIRNKIEEAYEYGTQDPDRDPTLTFL